MRRRLPVIDFDDIRNANPCSSQWDDMTGDDRVRYCGSCRQNVYNVAAMTKAEVAWLLAANEPERRSPCLRLLRREDGTLITADCWARLAAARRRGWKAFAATLAIVLLTQLALKLAAVHRAYREWRDEPSRHATSPATTPPTVPPAAPVAETVAPTPSVAPRATTRPARTPKAKQPAKRAPIVFTMPDGLGG